MQKNIQADKKNNKQPKENIRGKKTNQQLSFNNYIFKVNSSKESKKKKLRLNIKN